MKKILPIFLSLALFLIGFLIPFNSVEAQTAGTTPTPVDATGWVQDQEVTFIGKTAARANDFLEWTLQNYEWVKITEGTTNPLVSFWATIRNIVLALLALFVLAAAFVIIITRGQNLTVMKFIPRFLIIIVLIILSFALVQFLYQFFDLIQRFFLRVSDPAGGEDRFIGPVDLLYIGFDYVNFLGYRKQGIQFDESAYISLLLVKITAVTYYVMTGVLLIRKIILWFFIVISPVFPLLFFFRPLRNTGKIWIGEFFRWLLYAPLFAIFLHGLVVMWRDRIPLAFDFTQAGKSESVVYPTAINILLGGPGQVIGLNNSVNLSDTFAQYVVALLMLWVVILLPFLLLQIFLDYINNLAITESPLYQRIATSNIPFINRTISGNPPSPTPPPPPSPAATGMARALPFLNKKSMQIPVKRVTSADRLRGISNTTATSMSSSTSSRQTTTNITHETTDVMRLANLSIPKMRDIARMESASLTNNQSIVQEKTNVTNKLTQISRPASAPAIEREKFTTIKEKLIQQQQKGDPVANSILSASRIGSQVGSRSQDFQQYVTNKLNLTLQHIARPTTVLAPHERTKVQEIRQELLSAQQSGNPLASYVLDMSERFASEKVTTEEKQSLVEKVKEKLFTEKEKGNKLAEKLLPEEGKSTIAEASLPAVNRVQQVSLDEYEEVKNIWKENYTNLEPPTPLDGRTPTKEEWISGDIQKITETINLLSSPDQAQVQSGMEMVSDILPFLLIGGFSKAEVIAYLKAKLEAGKSVLSSVEQKKADDDSLLLNKPQQAQKQESLMMQRELPAEESSQNQQDASQNPNSMTPESSEENNNTKQ